MLKKVNLTQKSTKKSTQKSAQKENAQRKLDHSKKWTVFLLKNLKFVVNKKTDLSPHPPITESEF